MENHPERITDMEYALALAQHIGNPCGDQQNGTNLREFYIREAQRALPTLALPAREFLEEVILSHQTAQPYQTIKPQQ